MIRQYARRSLHCDLEDSLVGLVADKTEGFSNSDLEAVVKEVAQKKMIHKDEVDIATELLSSVESVISISKVNSELVTEITEWGAGRAIRV